MNEPGTPTFDPLDLLAQAGLGKAVSRRMGREVLFTQGSPADAIFFVRSGKVKLTVLSDQGRAAVVAIFGPGDFLGQECLTAEPLFLATAEALSDCEFMRIDEVTFTRALYENPALAQMFVSYLLGRVTRVELDLADQMVNSCEKRLARALLLLAESSDSGNPDPVVTRMSHQTLAELIGTSRSQVSVFMSDFRKRGLIDYSRRGTIEVHTSKLNHAICEMALPYS